MSTKPHYFKIGLFVICAVVMIVAAVVIFGAGMLAQDKMYFETYFDESITGLSVGSPVEFRGVRIGQVEKIGFVGSEYDLDQDSATVSEYEPYVRVVCSAPKAVFPELADEPAGTILKQMIERGLRVRITSNILTGQAYLEANYVDPNRFGILEVPWEPLYSYVPSAPGELTTMKDSIDKILLRLQEIDVEGLAASLENVFASLDAAISDVNVAELSAETSSLLKETRAKVAAIEAEKISQATQELLVSLNATVADANVPQLSREVRDLLAETRQKIAALDTESMNEDLGQLLASLDQAVADADIPRLSQEIQQFVAEIRVTNDNLRRLLAGSGELSDQTNLAETVARLNNALQRIDKLVATERPEIEVIIANFREISDNLKDLTGALKKRPSQLILSKPPAKSEALK